MPSSVRPRGKRSLGKFDVSSERVVNAHRLSDFIGGRAYVFDFAAENEVLDFVLNLVVELVAIGAEKLDAIVGVGIVRGGDDDAGVGAQAARDVRDVIKLTRVISPKGSKIERSPSSVDSKLMFPTNTFFILLFS